MTKPLSDKEIKSLGQEIRPTLAVGKNGITKGLIEELKKQIKEKKIVKVKVLATAEMDREKVAEILLERTASVLVEIRGNAVLICDRSIYKDKKDLREQR